MTTLGNDAQQHTGCEQRRATDHPFLPKHYRKVCTEEVVSRLRQASWKELLSASSSNTFSGRPMCWWLFSYYYNRFTGRMVKFESGYSSSTKRWLVLTTLRNSQPWVFQIPETSQLLTLITVTTIPMQKCRWSLPSPLSPSIQHSLKSCNSHSS